MIKAYHNCPRETAELIKADDMIRSKTELQRKGPTGLSFKDTRFVFLYPECFQHSKDRSTYRNETFVAFAFDAVQLIKRYNALVGKDLIALDLFASFIPDIRQRELVRRGYNLSRSLQASRADTSRI